jgi:hypothetical protein
MNQFQLPRIRLGEVAVLVPKLLKLVTVVET